MLKINVYFRVIFLGMDSDDNLITDAFIRFYKEAEKQIMSIDKIENFSPKNKTDFDKDEYYYIEKEDKNLYPAQIILLGCKYYTIIIKWVGITEK